jgi:hypothetical protein
MGIATIDLYNSISSIVNNLFTIDLLIMALNPMSNIPKRKK